mgnify:CR=1 FL=1
MTLKPFKRQDRIKGLEHKHYFDIRQVLSYEDLPQKSWHWNLEYEGNFCWISNFFGVKHEYGHDVL